MDERVKELLTLGREHYEKSEYAQAEYCLRQVLAHADRYADVQHMLGVICHAKGDFVNARTHFEKAVILNPNYTEAQLNLMVTYNELGKYDDAREIYSRIRERAQAQPADGFVKGKIANLHAQLSQAYLDAGMRVEAIRELEKAVGLCPGFADLRTRLGVLLQESGNLPRAREELEAARDANPKYVHARLTLGVLLLCLGENERAQVEFEAAVALDPASKSAQTYLRIARAQGEAGSSVPAKA
jgi:tetratricopeptide (TPR) repeat protein